MRSKTDSEIEQRVLKELRVNDNVGSAEICVFASNGVVKLSGTVPGYRNKSAAEAAAYQADEIRGVINDVRIKRDLTTIDKRVARGGKSARFPWAEAGQVRPWL
jgi:hypothetical protein